MKVIMFSFYLTCFRELLIRLLYIKNLYDIISCVVKEGFIAGLLLDFISLVWYMFLNGKLSVCPNTQNNHIFSLHIKFANKTITIKTVWPTLPPQNLLLFPSNVSDFHN